MARGASRLFHHHAGVEPEIGADIDEQVGLEHAAGAHEMRQLAVLADLGRNLEPADILRMHQEVGAEIAADEIMAVMNQPVERLIEAAPPAYSATATKNSCSPTPAVWSGAPAPRNRTKPG